MGAAFFMGGGFWHEGILELYSDGFYGCRRMAGLVYGYSQKDAGLYGYSMAIGVVIFLFSFALSACVNKATSRDPLEF